MTQSTASKDTGIDDIIGLCNVLQISETESTGRQNEHELRDAINNLAQAAAAIIQRVSQIQKLLKVEGAFENDAISEVCLLRKQVKKLPNVANTFVIEAERSVTSKVISLGGSCELDSSGLVSYFHPRITAITREVLKCTPDGAGVLWKVAEECYSQARSSSGRLYPNEDYFAPGDGTQAKEGDVKANIELTRRDWVGFWIKALMKCPEGPTLFYPPQNLVKESSDWSFTDVPRYLFRAFDSNSSGINNDHVISSSMEESGMLQRSKIDILSLGHREGTEMLYNHLNKGLFNAARFDNLMSWSSSLMFVIQYAIWRNFHGGLPSNRIQICTVDTRRFPAGQFAQDMKLLRLYKESMDLSTPRQQFNFVQFRLKRTEYINGEYLSQGKLNHRGRSCIFSLEDLIQAGLFRLYPEFGDGPGQMQWSNRVKKLRDCWSAELPTSAQEIDSALNIARECFGVFDEVEIALNLLAFKNRKIDMQDDTNNANSCEPIEVQRYERMARVLEKRNKNASRTRLSGGPHESSAAIIQDLFRCRHARGRSV